MLTKLKIRNFKRFLDVEVDLGNPVVFIGPNNSGKTTALQSLALWEVGLRRWREKRAGRATPERRPGVTINRRDLVSVPVPDANLLWRNLHVRDVNRVPGGRASTTNNVRIAIIVEGISQGTSWECGLEFDYANEESLYCRPLRTGVGPDGVDRMPVPQQAGDVRMAYLPPMSGLAANETRLDPGAVQVRIGEARTAEVLRNLCLQVVNAENGGGKWSELSSHIRSLFGVQLEMPVYVQERGEITMSYRETSARPSVKLDLSSAGRGLQQTLLLLAYLYSNSDAVLLLDEPDAHLEILRQQQIYQLLTRVATDQGSQIVAASHSEVVLNEAAGRDTVVAFVGTPHRIDDRGTQVVKALKAIGFDQFYLAEAEGWLLYLEGSTDLADLQAFAETLGHPAARHLERPFVHYVENQPNRAREHFHGLREAKPDLVAIAIFDQGVPEPQPGGALQELVWERREIENYLALPEALMAYAQSRFQGDLPLFGAGAAELMDRCIRERVPPAALRNRDDVWWFRTKMSDEFLDPLFDGFFGSLGLSNLMRKNEYHQLARLVPPELIPQDVRHKLDAIARVARRAHPLAGTGDAR